MSVPQGIKETLLWRKAIELVENIDLFAENLPDTELDLYGINSKLRDSVSNIPQYVENGYTQNSKAGRGKTVFMADLSLDECKSYLSQAKRMNLGETEGLIESVDQLRKMLYGEHVVGYNQPA